MTVFPMPRTFTDNDFEVRPSTIPGAGRGLFSKVLIEVGDTIGYYTGDIITEDALIAGKYSGSDYLMWVTKDHIIVGEGERANYTRYINHCEEEPNAFLITSTRWKSARLECVRRIQPGDEIFFNYGDDFFALK